MPWSFLKHVSLARCFMFLVDHMTVSVKTSSKAAISSSTKSMLRESSAGPTAFHGALAASWATTSSTVSLKSPSHLEKKSEPGEGAASQPRNLEASRNHDNGALSLSNKAWNMVMSTLLCLVMRSASWSVRWSTRTTSRNKDWSRRLSASPTMACLTTLSATTMWRTSNQVS